MSYFSFRLVVRAPGQDWPNEHINKYHGLKRESRDDLLSEDFHIQNYVCEKCDFETNFSLKWIQHTSACTEMKENRQSVTSPSLNDTYDFDFKPTDETSWYYCTQCSYKAKLKGALKCHAMIKHDLNNRYACEKCRVKCAWKFMLRIQINRFHLDEQDVVTKRIFAGRKW